METGLLFLIPIALAAVAIVLILGLLNMAKGGSPQRSQSLMQWRVLLQFVAIAVVLVAMWAAGR
jgi:NADH:ubiquinone oxidoreductase subunit H